MSPAHSGGDEEQRQIGLAAAAWIVKLDHGLTAGQQDEFFEWLAEDPRHGDSLARQRQSWRALDLLAQWRPEHSAEPNPDLLARPIVRRNRVWLWSLSACAATAAVTLFAFVRPDMLSRIMTRRTSERVATIQYERRTLEDGSVAELNAGAQLDVDFTAAERRVTLRHGEALFTVVKNPARPFIVHAAGVNVRAVGTAFNVRLGAGSVEVLVTEGRVQVAPPAARAVEQSSRALPASVSATPAEVSAGQRAVIALAAGASPHVTSVSMEEVARALAWQPQLLDFSSAPLSRVVAEFNRSNRVQLVLADPDLRDLPIVASIRSDNLDGLVRLLTATGGIRAEHRGADEIILHAQK